MSLNAYWEARASEVRAAEKANRDTARRGRDELVRHLLQPGAMADMVMARAQFAAPLCAADRPLPPKFCWMPKGLHEISAGTMVGGSWNGTVRVDEVSANSVQASFAELTREGWRSFIDFAHHNEGAAGWVEGFSWDPAVGIMCAVTWTPAGEEAIRSQVFVSFSPTFYIDNDSGRVAGLVKGHAAGGLVNSPAFGLAMPPITASGRTTAAALVRETLTKSGFCESSIAVITDAIRDNCDSEAVAALLRSLR